MYRSNTKATINAAIARSIANGKKSHQEWKNKSVSDELNSSDDMGASVGRSLNSSLKTRGFGEVYDRSRETAVGGVRAPLVCRGGPSLRTTKAGLHEPKQTQLHLEA